MSERPWWQSAIVYQIYPRSFQDSDGDGIGDLNGILARLDYLEWLGVDTVWLSPIYPSPMADFGYDVADYTGIHPMFGTLADFDRLVRGAARPGHADHPRLRAEPHLLRASLVPGGPGKPRQPAPRLVLLARSGPGRRAAQQLAEQCRRAGLDPR